MSLIINWFFTLLFLPIFGLILAGFHPFLVISHHLDSRLHKFFFDRMSWAILSALRICGTRYQIEISDQIPQDQPLILVSNHQSMYDIPLFVWHLRTFSPRFISKVELGRGIPSISHSLRTLGSVLIERKNPRQALPAIEEFGKRVESNRVAACLFPEGTRARDGQIKSFKSSGFKALLKSMPSALIVPVAIDGSWIIVRNGLLPVPFGTRVKFSVLAPLQRGTIDPDELIKEVELRIRQRLDVKPGEL